MNKMIFTLILILTSQMVFAQAGHRDPWNDWERHKPFPPGPPPPPQPIPPAPYPDENLWRRPYVILNQPVCGLTHVKMVVVGDNASIYNAGVLFDNGSSQEIPVGSYFNFAENSMTNWYGLVLYNSYGARCIRGYDIDAVSDADRDRAAIDLFGLQRIDRTSDYREVYIGRVNVRENFRRRDEWRRRHGDHGPGGGGGGRFPPSVEYDRDGRPLPPR